MRDYLSSKIVNYPLECITEINTDLSGLYKELYTNKKRICRYLAQIYEIHGLFNIYS